jgi:hypothetical protein
MLQPQFGSGTAPVHSHTEHADDEIHEDNLDDEASCPLSLLAADTQAKM